MSASIPESSFPRVVILGAGFAGLRLARKLSGKPFQVVLIDRHNYHQFQPLFYQVATAGLAPSAIAFPVRKLFHRVDNVHVRMAEALHIDTDEQVVRTSIGNVRYDYLVLATGADTNYFGNKRIAAHAFPMKSINESLQLRNRILQSMEDALSEPDEVRRQALMHIVIVGGGPTGVEVAGALSEMKQYILPKDYPELDFSKMKIFLIEAGPRLLGAMSERSSAAAASFLTSMGVEVRCGTQVRDYDGLRVSLNGQEDFHAHTLIWAAGIKGNVLSGIPENLIAPGGRVTCDGFNAVTGLTNVFALGDVCVNPSNDKPKGDPQVAQVAIQQADRLAYNLLHPNRPLPFRYRDFGSMATIGRSKAVVDLPFYHFEGFFAWLFWLFVHLMNILGVKNKFFIFIDWMWYYLSFDQSLRLVIKQKPHPEDQSGAHE